MLAIVFTLGCLLVAVAPGALSVNVNDVGVATPRATGLKTQVSIWLLKNDPKDKKSFLCSASIIDRSHALVHSTCLEFYNVEKLVVARGLVNLTSTVSFYPVKSVVYDTGSHMAIIEIAENTFETTSIVALRDKPLGTTSKCVMSGWLDGATPWKEYPVTYVDDAACKEKYAAIKVPVENGGVCALGPPGVAEQNCGALGMPLTCDSQLTGLFSLADFECKLPGQCTGVPHSKEWILKQIAPGGAGNMQPSLLTAIAAILVAYKTLA